MLGLLPDLTPRDSHSVWYTSSRNPHQSIPYEPTSPPDPTRPQNQNDHPHRRHHHQSLLERTQLARLRADETNAERRRGNIHNFGSTWLRPPGIAKTLHQLREEQREAAEHAEALRREQVQAELAEAAGADGDEFDPEVMEGESAMDDMGDGARDLDEDIPDADATGMSGIEVQSTVSSDLPSSSDEGSENGDAEAREAQQERQSELIQARMRMGNDSFRQAMARGDADLGDMYGAEEEMDPDAENQQGGVLEQASEAHFLHARNQLMDDDGVDMDMDADLDASVQEGAEMSGVYEHTDSEAEMSSSLPSSSSDGGRRRGGGNEDEDDDLDVSFAPRSSVGGMVGGGELRMPTSPTLMARGERTRRTRQSMDLSSLLSAGGSSNMGSSPQRR